MKEFSNAKMDKWTLFYTILYIFFSIGMVIFMFNTDAPKFALITLGSILSGAFIFAYFTRVFSYEGKKVVFLPSFEFGR